MTTRSASDLAIDRYLAELDSALRAVPAFHRNRILEEIREHIGEGRALLDVEDESSIGALLARIGDPKTIAAEAGAVDEVVGSRGRDAWVPWLLLLGAIPGVVFWLLGVGWILGVGFLWTSVRWRLSDKLIGTLVLPGGLLAFVLLLVRPAGATVCASHGGPGVSTVTHCTSSGLMLAPEVGLPLLIVLLVAPVFTIMWLRRNPHSTSVSDT